MLNGNSGFNNFGEYLLAVRRDALHIGSTDARLLHKRGAPLGSGEQVPSDGGFMVHGDFVRPLIERIYLNEIIGRCLEIPINSGNSLVYPTFMESSRANGSRFGGVEAYWENEADAATATKPAFGRGTLTAKKLIGLVYLTDELFMDAEALSIFGSMAFAKEMAFRLTDAIVNGDGSGKPQGILAGGAMIQVAKQNGQAAGSVVSQNIVDVWSRCWAPSRRTAVWLVHPDAEKQIIEASLAVGTAGGELSLYGPRDPESGFNTILGAPAIPIEQCQVPGTPGDVILADFSRYLLASRESRGDVSIHVKFLTDEVAFRFVMRVDGQPIDQVPVTPFTGVNTVSPFVTIAQRS
jgi:HK97 family phage major capsid protein